MTATSTSRSKPIYDDWPMLGSPDEIVDSLIDLYERNGEHRYDEAVTQAEHARQCGAHAMVAGASDEIIVAAFLHDLGHLLAGSALDTDDLGRRRHEELGAVVLGRWFPVAVTAPIELHVAAKRYLCAADAEYRGLLSDASQRSLETQGGPMSAAEMAEFRHRPYSQAAVELRSWDERSKDPGAPAPALDVFHTLMLDVLHR